MCFGSCCCFLLPLNTAKSYRFLQAQPTSDKGLKPESRNDRASIYPASKCPIRPCGHERKEPCLHSLHKGCTTQALAAVGASLLGNQSQKPLSYAATSLACPIMSLISCDVLPLCQSAITSYSVHCHFVNTLLQSAVH